MNQGRKRFQQRATKQRSKANETCLVRSVNCHLHFYCYNLSLQIRVCYYSFIQQPYLDSYCRTFPNHQFASSFCSLARLLDDLTRTYARIHRYTWTAPKWESSSFLCLLEPVFCSDFHTHGLASSFVFKIINETFSFPF